jgi:hypothetical protein
VRVLRVHPTPRASGAPLRADRLLKRKNKYVIEWGCELLGEGCESESVFATLGEALVEWRVFPRQGEEVIK